jgi:hypothetical protein
VRLTAIVWFEYGHCKEYEAKIQEPAHIPRAMEELEYEPSGNTTDVKPVKKGAMGFAGGRLLDMRYVTRYGEK